MKTILEPYNLHPKLHIEVLQEKYGKIDVQVLYDDDDKIFKAILSGASGYLLKKTTPARILEAIAEISDGGASMNASIVKRVLNFFSQQNPAAKTNDYTLSPKEMVILQCLVNGDSYKMIGDHCNISIGTVRSHINNIYKKLHINSKSEAVAKVLKERLLS